MSLKIYWILISCLSSNFMIKNICSTVGGLNLESMDELQVTLKCSAILCECSFDFGKGRSTCFIKFPKRFMTPERANILALQRETVLTGEHQQQLLSLPYLSHLKLDHLHLTCNFLSSLSLFLTLVFSFSLDLTFNTLKSTSEPSFPSLLQLCSGSCLKC